MKDLSDIIMAYALQNAVHYGKADAGRVLPKLFQHGLQKEDIKQVMPLIVKAAKHVNAMKPEERVAALGNLAGLVKKQEVKEKDLPALDLKGLKKVVTRMAPEPSKYAHLGHALTFLINYVYAKRYKGRCLLRLEDTNPDKVSKEYAEGIIEDIRDYLGIPVKKIRYVSDDMPKLYAYATKLVKGGHAYMCFCAREKMQDLRHQGIECECRQFPVKIHVERWKSFLTGGFVAGDAVLRLKGDMQSLNHVMRDPALFRRVDANHYRHGAKYTVWPLYDFYNPIEDHLMGVTLILRSNEFDTRVELQDKLKELLGLKKQIVVQYGRFNVEDFTTKGREIRDLFASGELLGWDDPRLITLRALRRRGITREALYELVKQIGLSKHPVNLQFDMIAAINRKLIDPIANRYSFVSDPVKLALENAPAVTAAEVPIHPDHPEKKKFVPVKDIFIAGADYTALKGKEIRLLHLYNLRLKDAQKAVFSSIEVQPLPKIQWVSEGVPARILMPDGTWRTGLAEKAIAKLKVGTLLQFERLGFVRYDGKNKGVYDFWFAHT